mgnify:FL=1
MSLPFRTWTQPPHAPGRVLAIATWQQAALTFVRFGVPALAPFLRADFGLSLSQIGFVIGAINLGAFVAFYPTGRATAHYGERLVMASGSVIVALACVALLFANTWGAIAAGLAVAGIGFPSSQIAGSRAVYGAFARRRRGLAMGIRQAGLPLGGLLAALVLPWLADHLGWRAAIAAAGAIALSGGLFCLGMPQSRKNKTGSKPLSGRDAVRQFLTRPDLLGITAMAMLLAVSQFCILSYLPLYLVDDFHLPRAVAALSLIGLQIGGIIGRMLWGHVSDRLANGNRTGTLIAVCLAGAVAAVTLTTGTATAVYGLAIVAGATTLGWNGLYVTLLNERLDRNAATLLSLSMMCLYIIALFAPPLFGQVLEAVGYRWAWVGLVVPQLAAASLAWRVGR